MNFTISGNIVDILQHKIFKGDVNVQDGLIQEITFVSSEPDKNLPYILPGFIDAHVHVESSMLVPSEFAKLAVVHGTVSTISDPHEIANVCGVEGVRYMIENGKTVPFKFNFGAPSCVPATTFETAGAEVTVADIEELLQSDDVKYLTEMMNFPGVLHHDKNVMAKIAAAKRLGKPVDGHAPGLRGDLAKQYIDAGISTDHECFTLEEARDKLMYRMKILIREGSAAKNFEALVDLLHEHSENIMFCSDDKHPDSLAESHINELCARAVKKGIDVFKVLKAACINPIEHYKLDVGFLRKGDKADFIAVENLDNFKVLKTFINGQLVAENGKSLIVPKPASIINNFHCAQKRVEDFATKWNGEKEIVVMEALDGQLITNKLLLTPTVEDGNIVSNMQTDVLKIVVVNRYNSAPVAKAFIKNFGLKQGAIASSVAHDSHNIVAVGVDDESLCKAVNLVIEKEGGVSCVGKDIEMILGLPVAGLMSNADGYVVAAQYAAIDKAAKSLGSTLSAPFMTLSFMALLVIPHAKLSDKGLFDGDSFTFFVETHDNASPE
jgi:adenine deaminase